MANQPIPNKAIEAAKTHALLEHAKGLESCGLVIGNTYYRCKNISPTPATDFKISNSEIIVKSRRGKIKAVIHSHDNYPHCSEKDQIMQEASGYPWVIINIFNNRVDDVWTLGLGTDPLVGRKFRNGSHDCYALVADFYQQEGNVILKRQPHGLVWFRDKKSEEGNIIRPATDMIVDNVKNFGFHFISPEGPFQYGDILMARDSSEVINHTGICLSNGLLLHHMWGRLSCREPLINWMKYVERAARYNEKIF